MSVVVIGCGRSGTNVVLEMLRGSPSLKASEVVENKHLCKPPRVHPDNYLTKCDTFYITFKGFCELMEKNPQMKVAWSIRDPRDMAMSKLRRGVPVARGGDCNVMADDATVHGLYDDIRNMTDLYMRASEYRGRVYVIKMEVALLNPEGTAKHMSAIFEIDYSPDMINFPSRMRNKKKRERYTGIDTNQVGLWKNWRTAYDGWLEKEGFEMDKIFEELKPITEYFGYAV